MGKKQKQQFQSEEFAEQETALIFLNLNCYIIFFNLPIVCKITCSIGKRKRGLYRDKKKQEIGIKE